MKQMTKQPTGASETASRTMPRSTIMGGVVYAVLFFVWLAIQLHHS